MIVYQLMVTNNQQINLSNIEIVDILPYVGDTGVILTNQSRGSQFDVYATGAVVAEIVHLLGEPTEPNPDIAIYYSTSKDPIRFDQLGNTIDTGVWSDTPPQDITTLASVKLITGADVILHPYERLIVTMPAKAPVGAIASTIAYNSFAVRANKIDGSTMQPMLPTEPNKVSTQIISDNMGGIGQFVWDDYNGDGIWQPNEPGVNGITVELFDSQMQLLSTTVNANNAGGEAGYYYFGNLSQGLYYVKFVPIPPYSITKQNLQDANGSRADPTSGAIPLIVLLTSQVLLDINCGLIGEPCDYPIIVADNKCIHMGATFDPLDGVSAFDCNGNNITHNVIVVSNTVDPSKEGLYSVQYSVKDYRSQQTDLTIQVVVCQGSARQGAITDLIQAVALQQSGLANIINAEGDKISKAKSLDFTDQQMLQINDSVMDLTNSIISLVVVLSQQSKICQGQMCGGDCCDGFAQTE